MWTTPPAATEVVLEQLCRNKHLFESNLHISCLLTLLTFRRGKQLGKVVDVIVLVPFNYTVWSEITNFELFDLAIILLFHSQPPSKLRNSNFVSQC